MWQWSGSETVINIQMTAGSQNKMTNKQVKPNLVEEVDS